VNKASKWILPLVAATLSFYFLYTFLGTLAKPIIPGALLNDMKYVAYLLLLGSATLAFVSRVKSFDEFKKAPRQIKLAALLLAWTVLTFTYSQASLWQSARGLSVDFSGIIMLLTIWLWRPTAREGKIIAWTAIANLLAFAALAVPEAIANHAFRIWANHDLELHMIQQHIPQLRSLTSGPNPFGTLMVLLSALIVWQVKDRRWRYGLLAFSGLILGLTFARSAWLGAGIMGAGIFFTAIRKRMVAIWPIVLAVSILFGASFGAIRYHESVINVLTHGKSNDEHAKTAKEALDEAKNRTFQASVFGFGIGTAGPVVYGTAEENKGNFVKITEDWYLQLIEEIGFVGLLLYLWLYYETVKQLFNARQALLGWLSIGLALNALFLHIWSTDINLNLIFWAIVGTALYQMDKRQNEHSS
jgi:hypothetical protein